MNQDTNFTKHIWIFLSAYGVCFAALSFGQEVPVSIRELMRERDDARKRGDFKKADQIRTQLKESGYLLEDTAGGTVVRKRV